MENIIWNNYATKDAGYTFNRTNPIPADKTQIWDTLENAQTYASTDPVAYIGQTLTVVDATKDTVTLYIINKDKGLTEIGTADTASGIAQSMIKYAEIDDSDWEIPETLFSNTTQTT